MAFALQLNRPFEFRVIGGAVNQAVVNIIHGTVAGTGATGQPSAYDAAVVLNELLVAWRANILPPLGNLLKIDRYELAQITTVVRIDGNPPTVPHKYHFKYGGLVSLKGTPADVGGVADAHMPTYVAVSVKKVGNASDHAYRGSIRLGPITEGRTQDFVGGNPNQLTDNAQPVFQAAVDALLAPAVLTQQPAQPIRLAIVSRKRMYEQPGGVDQWSSGIGNFLVKDLVGSQVTRKQVTALL